MTFKLNLFNNHACRGPCGFIRKKEDGLKNHKEFFVTNACTDVKMKCWPHVEPGELLDTLKKDGRSFNYILYHFDNTISQLSNWLINLCLPESATAVTGFTFGDRSNLIFTGWRPWKANMARRRRHRLSCSLKISVKLRSMSAPLLWLCKLGCAAGLLCGE